jgi:hypothetical protein
VPDVVDFAAASAVLLPPAISLKPSDIPMYSGDPSSLDRWVHKCQMYFDQFPPHAMSDSTRNRIASMRLDMAASDIVMNAPYLFHPTATWADFVALLTATFAPLNRTFVARNALPSCKQTSTVQEYLLHFNIITGQLPHLSADEKLARFMEGLTPTVRQKLWLRQPPPRTFREAAEAASLLDVMSNLPSAAAAFAPALPPRPNPYRPPARLNAIGSPSTAPPTPRTPLTPEERARLLATGGCTYCRLPGHTIDACPTKPPRPAHWVNQSGNGRPQ